MLLFQLPDTEYPIILTSRMLMSQRVSFVVFADDICPERFCISIKSASMAATLRAWYAKLDSIQFSYTAFKNLILGGKPSIQEEVDAQKENPMP